MATFIIDELTSQATKPKWASAKLPLDAGPFTTTGDCATCDHGYGKLITFADCWENEPDVQRPNKSNSRRLIRSPRRQSQAGFGG
jgi:hypothetical protein